MSSFQKNHKPAAAFYDFVQAGKVVRVFLHERPNVVIDALLIGFDEFMNMVLDNAIEINTKTQLTTPLGKTLLKSDCVALVAQKP